MKRVNNFYKGISLFLALLYFQSCRISETTAQDLECNDSVAQSDSVWVPTDSGIEIKRFEKFTLTRPLPQPRPLPQESNTEQTAALPTSRIVCLTAVRFKLDENKISLLNVYNYLFENASTAGGVRKVGENLDPIVFSIESLFKFANLEFKVVANAGWASSGNPPVAEGYLRIGGSEPLSPIVPYLNLTALICFDGNEIKYLRYNKFVKHPWNDRNWDESDQQLFKTCNNMIQVGPAILEQDNRLYLAAREAFVANVTPIVSQDELIRLKEYLNRIRTCLAPDKRIGICNAGEPGKRTVLGKDEGGFYYLIEILNDAYLSDVQELLLGDKFPAPRKMIWAINLAGDSQAGMAIKVSGTSLLRNGTGSVLSVIVLSAR